MSKNMSEDELLYTNSFWDQARDEFNASTPEEAEVMLTQLWDQVIPMYQAYLGKMAEKEAAERAFEAFDWFNIAFGRRIGTFDQIVEEERDDMAEADENGL